MKKILLIACTFIYAIHGNTPTIQEKKESLLKKYCKNVGYFAGTYLVTKSVEELSHYLAAKALGSKVTLNRTLPKILERGPFKYKEFPARALIFQAAGPVTAYILLKAAQRITNSPEKKYIVLGAFANVCHSVIGDGWAMIQNVKENCIKK
jgi:hypothetical protein